MAETTNLLSGTGPIVTDRTTLLIDDDPTQIAILQAYLASMNLGQSIAASDAREALAHVGPDADSKIDLIFTDLGMPNMDGFEFLKHLSKIEYRGDVIIISGHENILLESAASLGKMYGLSIKGQIRKPLTKFALDRLFTEITETGKSRQNPNAGSLSADDLREGIRNGEIIPYYQPKVDLLSGRVVGAEALARWVRPGRKNIGPGEFIPLAEKSGLIVELSESILNSIIADYSANAATWADKKISVNLPPELVRNTMLPELLEQRLASHSIPNSAFCIEITESGVIDFDPISIEVLSRLRIKGFDLSIDDFGTGAANISNLKVFPYSELKIDQTFINNVLTDAFSAETVRTSVSLARQLGIRIVAEGIETEEVLQYVKSKGIDQAQGFLFSRPVPAEDINKMFESPLSWINNRTTNAA